MIKIFKYIEPIWLGAKSQLSIRRVLALAFSINLMYNITHIINTLDAHKSYSDIAMILGIEATLIAALLALTTYSTTILNKNQNGRSNNPQTNSAPPSLD